MIDARELIRTLNESEVILLANSEDVGAVKLIMRIITNIRDADRVRNEKFPKRDDENLSNDWVHINGGIARLNDVLSLPQVARNIINHAEQKANKEAQK